MKLRPWPDALIAILIFLLVFTAYAISGNRFSFDSQWSIPTALSIVREGNTNLDEYRDLIAKHDEFGAIETFNGHSYTNFPIGAPLLATPIVFVIDQYAQHVMGVDLQAYVRQTIPEALESLVASFLVTWTVVVIYFIARLYLNRRSSLVVVFIFAFCTPVWSTASRALWQFVPALLMLSLTLYLLLRAKDKPQLAQFAALPLAMSYVSRPTNSLAVVLLTLYVWLQYRRYFLRYLLWAAAVAVPFVLYNWSLYHAPLPPYYSEFERFSLATFLPASIGTLFSPGRGLFVFIPILSVSIAGVALKLRRRTFNWLDAFVGVILLLTWLTLAVWPIWWGGWSFGPRMFTDTMPYWIYFMLPVFAALPTAARRVKVVSFTVIALLAAASFFIHYRGANVSDTVLDWSLHPANVDTHTDRFWDWRDVQFLRGLTWGSPIDLSISGVPANQLEVGTFLQWGGNVLRARRFDASHALVSPPEEAWVVLADRQSIAPEFAALFQGAVPQGHGVAQEQDVPYQLYRFDLGARLQQAAQQAQHTAFLSPDLYPDRSHLRPIELPVSFGSTADLLGFTIAPGAGSRDLTLVTYWRAGDQVASPLRAFVHAINADGQIVAQDDRLDSNSKDWRPGDLLMQISRLSIPVEAGPVWLEAGLYHPASGARLPILIDRQEMDQRVLLHQNTPAP